MKNTISLILLHSTYPICQHNFCWLCIKCSQNLTTPHCHPCPSHASHSRISASWDSPAALGLFPSTVTWKSDHVAALQVRSGHPSTKVLSISLRVSCILSSIPQDPVQSHPTTASLVFIYYSAPPSSLQTELIPCSSLTTAGRLWLQSFVPPRHFPLPGTFFLKDQCGWTPWIFPQMPPFPWSIAYPLYLMATTRTSLPIQLFCFTHPHNLPATGCTLFLPSLLDWKSHEVPEFCLSLLTAARPQHPKQHLVDSWHAKKCFPNKWMNKFA